MTDTELLAVEVATLFVLDDTGLLLRVNQPGGGPAPRFCWGSTRDGSCWWRRADLPVHAAEAAARGLAAQATGTPLDPMASDAIAAARAAVEPHGAIAAFWHGPSFVVPEASLGRSPAILLRPDDTSLVNRLMPDWTEDLATRQPFAAVVVDGAAVSICAVARHGQQAMEAGVETHPAWRGRGFAAAATAQWAVAVRDLGLTPIYSTSWDNVASQRVAARLGLRQFASLLHLT